MSPTNHNKAKNPSCSTKSGTGDENAQPSGCTAAGVELTPVGKHQTTMTAAVPGGDMSLPFMTHAEPTSAGSPIQSNEPDSCLEPQVHGAPRVRLSGKSFAERLRDLPRDGTGMLHRAIYTTALAGLSEGLPVEVVRDRLLEAAVSKGRAPWAADREVTRAVSNANRWLFDTDAELTTGDCARPTRTRVDVRQILRVLRDGDSLSALQALSGPIPDANRDLLVRLFGSDALVCCGWEINRIQTRPLQEWPEELSELQFVVANPMSALTGRALDGECSYRCLENTGPRRHIVIEFDFKPGFPGWEELHFMLGCSNKTLGDLNSALLLHLQRFLPLRMVISSGNRSLHGWFSVEGTSEEDQARFMNYAASLGADPMVFTPCQLVRMPGGTRSNGTIQNILYFNNVVI